MYIGLIVNDATGNPYHVLGKGVERKVGVNPYYMDTFHLPSTLQALNISSHVSCNLNMPA